MKPFSLFHPHTLALLTPLLITGATACARTQPPLVPPPPLPPVVTPPDRAQPNRSSVTPDAEFRKTAPPRSPDVRFVPPKIEEAKLSNGIRILLVERHDLPIVAIQIAVDQGADQATPGVGAFAGSMLLAGTKKRSALQINDAFQALGADYRAWSDFDSLDVRAQVLTPNVDSLLELLSDIAQNPTFPTDEIQRERSQRLTALAQENDSPALVLRNTVADVLYPAHHPYKFSLLGTEDSLTKLTATDLKRYHQTHMQPDRITIAVAGDMTQPVLLEKLEKSFGAWKGKSTKGTVPVDPPAPSAKDHRIVLVDRPGATQSNVAIAMPGVPRSTRDFDTLTVLNTLLGGQFSSRLNLNLREKHAYTYGARSLFDMRHGAGPFSAGGAMVRESTEPALHEILSEINRIRKEPVSDEELADAKSYLIRTLPARFETVGETASTLASLSIYGLPLNEFATRTARVQKVTKEELQHTAEKYFTSERIRIVVVGDASAVQKSLDDLGLGPIEVRSAKPKAAMGANAGSTDALSKQKK